MGLQPGEERLTSTPPPTIWPRSSPVFDGGTLRPSSMPVWSSVV
jgi:hypothetical protein